MVPTNRVLEVIAQAYEVVSMTQSRDPPKPPPAPPAGPQTDPQSGHVQFDSRGNAVWEWRTETGQFSTEINTQRLKKLVDSDLSLEQTGKVKAVDGRSIEETALGDTRSGKGFNPYNHAESKPKSPDPYQRQTLAATSKKPAAPEPTRKPIKDLKAYGEWLAMKKRLADQKDDD
jgi:hypothetical protein